MKYLKKVSVGQFARKGEDYKDGDIIQIANEGQEINGTYGMQNVFLVKLADGSEKNLTFNQTTINNLIDAYGDDSIQWIGKQAKVWLILQSVSGKMLKVTYLTHPSAQIVESANGMDWEIPGKQAAAPSKPEGYPAEVSSPDDIPF